MPANSQSAYLARASETYARQLEKVSPVRDTYGAIPYLTEHGLGYAAAMRYQLGIVDEPMPGDDQFRGMLSIPYLSRAGVMALKFRQLAQGASPKYQQRAGQKVRLYNVAAYFAADDVIGLAEGEIDAISATESLGLPTIGIPGTQMWAANERTWRPVFKDFRAVVLFRDGDTAGREMSKELASAIGWRLRTVACPDGMDVSSAVAAGLADELRHQWQEAAK